MSYEFCSPLGVRLKVLKLLEQLRERPGLGDWKVRLEKIAQVILIELKLVCSNYSIGPLEWNFGR